MNALKTLVNPYSSIGDLHNQGLDYIAQKLMTKYALFFFQN